MSQSSMPFDRKALRRAVGLGLVVFVTFVLAAALLSALGSALGLARVPALLLGICLGPLLVAVPVLFWVYSLPLERRQKLLGVTVSAPPAAPEPPEGEPTTE